MLNFEILVKYLDYIQLTSFVIGIILVGGAITLPTLNEIAEELLGKHAFYLILILIIAIVGVLLSLFSGNVDVIEVFLNSLLTLFLFLGFVIIGIAISILLTSQVKWLLILGVVLILNYVYTNYVKISF